MRTKEELARRQEQSIPGRGDSICQGPVAGREEAMRTAYAKALVAEQGGGQGGWNTVSPEDERLRMP